MTHLHYLLAYNVRRARHRLGYTQAFVAEQCDVTPGHISEIEHGHSFPSPRLFEQLAHVLAVKPYELMLDRSDDQSTGERHSLLSFAQDLKHHVIADVDELIRDYLSR